MKKFRFFIIMIVLVWPWLVQAQPNLALRISDGQYEVKEVNTGIFANIGTEDYSIFFSSAIKKPGEKILVKIRKPVLEVKIDFKKTVEVKKTFIVFEPTDLMGKIPTGRICLIEEKEIAEEPAYLMYFGVFLIFLLLLNTVIKKSGKTDREFWPAFITIIFFAICGAMIIDLMKNYNFTFSTFSLFPVLFFGVWFICSDPDDQDAYSSAKEKLSAQLQEVWLGFLAFVFIFLYFLFLILGI